MVKMTDEYTEASNKIIGYIEKNGELDNSQFEKELADFQSKYSPEVLKQLKGKNLLYKMFYNDENTHNLCHDLEFEHNIFGSIKGGSSYKFTLFKNKENNKWKYGASPKNFKFISEDEAITEAEKIRDALVNGAEYIKETKLETIGDYNKLDNKLNEIFKDILLKPDFVFVHKYFSMIVPDKVSVLHSRNTRIDVLKAFKITLEENTFAQDGQIKLITKGANINHYLIWNYYVELCHTLYNPENKEIWTINAGEDGKYWNRFYEDEIISIGWGDLGDLNDLDENEIEERLNKYYPTGKKQPNNKRALIDFSKKMSIGDIVIIKKGKRELLGLGIITSNYIFDENLNIGEDYCHYRKVDYLINKKAEVPSKISTFSTKTLTPITPYKELCIEIFRKMGYNPIDYKIPYKTNKSPIEIQEYTEKDFLNETLFKKEDFEELINLLKRKKNIILQGPPGVGKTYISKRLAYAMINCKDDDKIEFIQFHQNYSYEDFIQGYKPNEEHFSLENGVFYEFCNKAANNPDNDYFFIIDEINRGNISKIFGEILMLIEKDKRGPKNGIYLTYDKTHKFYVPENLYIIGMMNTADKSLAIIDYALRRRFVFIDIKPLFDDEYKEILIEKLIDEGTDSELANEIIYKINQLNDEIANDSDLGNGFKIGHSYFLDDEITLNKDSYNSIIKYEIAPLLREYWFDNIEKANQKIEELYL